MQEPRGRAIWLVAIMLLSAVPFTAGTSAQDVEDTGLLHAASEPVAEAQGPVDAIVAPTGGAPQFVLQGDSFRVELSPSLPDTAGSGPGTLDVALTPSYGDGPSVEVELAGTGQVEASTLWEGPWSRQVLAYTGQVPSDLEPGLYDIEAASLDDEARRSLAVYEAWPEEPRIVLVADTQTGDPRAMEDGFHESTGIQPLAPHETRPEDLVLPPDPHPANNATEQTLGIDLLELELEPGDRWWAYRAAIKQINKMAPAPDLVLFSGDLNFGQMVPGSWHVEYEESWALINGGPGVDGTEYEGFHVPTLLSPGNHDLYVASGEDGLAYWEAFFGPPAYSTTFGNATLVSLNTYDWSELDRTGASYAVSAWGGQIQEAQLAWARETFCEAGGGIPLASETAHAGVGCLGHQDTRIVTFGHHSPSWVQDPWQSQYGGAYEQCPCQGTPGLEQAGRGIVTFTTTDQGWSGDGRLALRDTLREFGVDMHAAGHEHRDRIARDIGDGTIVETPQLPREGLSRTQLHLVHEDGQAQEIGFEAGKALMESGTGPLYLETTTTASGTDQYWGYKPVIWHTGPADMPSDALGIPPFEMGYPMTPELLNQTASEPSHWNAAWAELGLYSTPTFLPAS